MCRIKVKQLPYLDVPAKVLQMEINNNWVLVGLVGFCVLKTAVTQTALYSNFCLSITDIFDSTKKQFAINEVPPMQCRSTSHQISDRSLNILTFNISTMNYIEWQLLKLVPNIDIGYIYITQFIIFLFISN